MKRKKNKKFVENTRPMFAEENKIIFQKGEIKNSHYEANKHPTLFYTLHC